MILSNYRYSVEIKDGTASSILIGAGRSKEDSTTVDNISGGGSVPTSTTWSVLSSNFTTANLSSSNPDHNKFILFSSLHFSGYVELKNLKIEKQVST